MKSLRSNQSESPRPYCIFRRDLRTCCLLLACSVALVGIASLSPVADKLFELIERVYPPMPVTTLPDTDAIIVLGGGLVADFPSGVSQRIATGPYRSWYACQLLRAGKAPVIFAVGEESADMTRFLVELGIARPLIVEEPRSRNTFQNAAYVKPMLKAHGIKRALLVTSASHMPRAIAIFRAAGIDVVPASAYSDFLVDRKYAPDDFLPNTKALFRSFEALGEVAGCLHFLVRKWLMAQKSSAV